MRKEFKIGIMTVVAGMMLYFGVRYLRGVDFLATTKKYVVYYTDINGLTVSNPVLLNGLAVGKVRDIRLMTEKNNELEVTIEIDGKIAVTDQSDAQLIDTDFLGGKAVQLNLSSEGNLLENKGVIKGTKEQSITELIEDKTTPILKNLDSTMHYIQSLTKQVNKTVADLDKVVKNVEQSTYLVNAILAENKKSLKGTMNNLSKFTGVLANTEKDIKPMLQKLNQFSDTLAALKLAQTINSTNKTLVSLDQTLTQVNSGKGSIGLLMKDEGLYHNLNNSTRDLDSLLIDMRKRPQRYVHFSVFGRKEKKK